MWTSLLLHAFIIAISTSYTSAQATNPSCTYSPSQTLPLSVLYPTPTQGYGWKHDDSQDNDKVVISNFCDYPVYIWSVGARQLGGPRLNNSCDPNAYMTNDDRTVYTVEPGGDHEEPYRTTCIRNETDLEYCPDGDKVSSQGVSLKISKVDGLPSDITQFEYSLEQNPFKKDTFKRLNYRISMIDCYRNTSIKDADATDEEHKAKQACPGYADGIGIAFDADPQYAKCPLLFCSGEHKCSQIYTWEWTEREEASLICREEYHGRMRLLLCANGDHKPGEGPEIATSMEAAKCHYLSTATNSQLHSQASTCTVTYNPITSTSITPTPTPTPPTSENTEPSTMQTSAQPPKPTSTAAETSASAPAPKPTTTDPPPTPTLTPAPEPQKEVETSSQQVVPTSTKRPEHKCDNGCCTNWWKRHFVC